MIPYSCNELDPLIHECWYIINNTEESLVVKAIAIDVSMSSGDTACIYGRHRELDKDFDISLLDYSRFYSGTYGTYKDIILCDSMYNEIITWSIYDEIIDAFHLMNEGAWQRLYEPNKARISWFYTISQEDLIQLRGY